MWVPITIAFVVTLVTSALCINKFINLRTQSLFFNITLIISLFLPFSIIFILPIDLISTSIDNNGGNDDSTAYYSLFYLRKEVVLIIWKLNYWVTFLLTWLILPFAQYWYSSGHFNKRLRFRESVLSVIKFLLLMIIVGTIGLIYMLIKHRDWVNFTSLKGLVITLSHIYSLFLALWLMAHGLIFIPRHTWLNSGYYNKRLNQMYLNLPQQKEKLEDLKFDLKDLCGKIKKMENLNNLEHRDWIYNLILHIPAEFKDLTYHGDIFSNEELNTNLLSSLMKDLKFKIWRYNDAKVQYEDSLSTIVELEDRINGQLIHELNYRLVDSGFKKFLNNHPEASYYLSQYVRPWSGRLTALIFAAISVIVLESELTHGFQISIINLIVKSFRLNIFKIFGLCFIVLSYMVISAMTSLSQIKVFNIYHISPNQNSDPVSTIFFISYAARLTIPLSYNFLMLLNTNYTGKSQFQQFLGNSIQLIPIGVFLNNMLPRLLIIPILLSVFRVGEKLKNWAKGVFLLEYIFDELEYDDDETDIRGGSTGTTNIEDLEIGGVRNSVRENQKIQEAKRLIQHELSVLERERATVIPGNVTRPLTLPLTSPSRSDNMLAHNDFDSLAGNAGGFFSGIGASVKRIFNFRRNAGGLDDYSDYESLRTLTLGSRRNQRDSLSTTTTNSSLRGSFETDNRIMGDDDIIGIDDDDSEDNILL